MPGPGYVSVFGKGVNLYITLGGKILRKLGKVQAPKPRRFLTFYAKMEYIFGYVNFIFFSNRIEKIADERSFY